MLRLLVPSDSLHETLSYGQFTIEGLCWHVIDGNKWLEKGNTYACISYAWGSITVPNTLYGGSNIMSIRTIPVLETVIRTLRVVDANPIAVWIDALCLPPKGDPTRTQGIDEMGKVYSAASRVIVVLSKDSKSFLKLASIELKGQAGMEDMAPLEKLEQDLWVTRVWTYQEIANCKGPGWLFVSEGDPESIAVTGLSLLDMLGNVRAVYKRKYRRSDGTVIREADSETSVCLRLPNVSMLEDVLADCILEIPLQHSALQTMSNVNRRFRERGEDYFNSMIGAISNSDESSAIRVSWTNIKESPQVRNLCSLVNSCSTATDKDKEKALGTILDPIKTAFAANQFMQICEAKGDYSFIYTTSQRSHLDGQRWRPVPELLQPIFPLHSKGTRQPGSNEKGQLTLDEMIPQRLRHLSPKGEQFLEPWTRILYPDAPDLSSIETVRNCIQQYGFVSTSEADVLTLEFGYFFPQSAWEGDLSEMEVFLSSSIVWVCGCPAVLGRKSRIDPDCFEFLCVGAFIGDRDASERSAGRRPVSFEGGSKKIVS